MKAILIAAVLGMSISMSYAAGNPQQELMKKCSAENKGKKGDEYKTAQKACLSDGKTAANSQQSKMKKCSAENKGKKGQEYKDAQKACLSS